MIKKYNFIYIYNFHLITQYLFSVTIHDLK